MTLIEAIKSEKRFKRKPHLVWLVLTDKKYIGSYGLAAPTVCLERQDILADDWEIEEETIQITRSQLIAGLDRAYHYCHEINRNSTTYEALAKELGFRQDSSKEEGE